jgi:hypothetical protein
MKGRLSGHRPHDVPATESVLPYTDTKPVGAPDFYAAVNATFRFIEHQLGPEGLRRYWTELGEKYYAPVARRWLEGGLPAVAAHWRAFFAAEPGSEAEICADEKEVLITVSTCPAIRYLREHGREIMPSFCQHCYYVSAAMGASAGFEVRICGGNGSCSQRFALAGHFTEAQRLEDISTAS